MEADGDHFLAYYLTKEDDVALEFKQERLTRSSDAPEEDEVRLLRDFWTCFALAVADLPLTGLSANSFPFRSRLRCCEG